MSRLVAIVGRDGAPLDGRLVTRMVEGLPGGRAPRVRVDGAVALAHTPLGGSLDAGAAPQPLSLDGATWIVADARLDDRAALVRWLCARGRAARAASPDAALILHAYHAAGEACVDRLLGDFAFAIWDGERRRLFCARDHFGVKPLFYAAHATALVVGSSLDTVLRHPRVSRAVSDDSIVGFLCGEEGVDPEATAYVAVRRLPAAHVLTATEAGLRTRRYWRLPADGEVRYRRATDYAERFTELLECAVADRLGGRQVAVLMSGGLDSTTVAAAAKRCLARDDAPFDLRAYTTVCEALVPDPERPYAQLAADALGMPIHYRLVDGYQAFERWDKPELRRAEPQGDPLLAVHVDQLAEAAVRADVLLTGYGGDPAMRLPLSYALGLVRRGRLLRLAVEAARYVAVAGRMPRVRLGTHARRWLRAERRPEAPPPWLAAPWRDRPAHHAATVAAPGHASRPDAYALLSSPEWAAIFEAYDANVTGVPLEVRHPLFDRRLVEYLLAIPPMPWCFDKTIMRIATRGALPAAVRWRPKAVAAADPLVTLLQAPEAAWVDRFEPTAALGRYVDRSRVPPLRGERDSAAVWMHARPLCLDYWLRWHDHV
jgi:asparagine synthase (glutamine-hydrolysing)